MIFFTQKKWKVKRLLALLLITFCSHVLLAQSQQQVTGKIIDAVTNEPIIGTSIHVVGSAVGVAADVNGSFKISVPDGGSLEFKNIGYITSTQKATFNKPMLVKLSPSAANLNEVVVVGYGTQKLATVTGAIATVTAKEFQDRGPTNNPIANLQGQVPGVVVTRTSAQPGRENWNFQIRGATSVNNADPLVILDGVAINNNNELNSLNPDDIDNISFLKDASAAIYGSRAAYGVVLITTKKGKNGKLIVQYSPSVSEKLLGLQPKMTNISEWANGLKEAKINDNYGVVPTTDLWYQMANFAIANDGTVVLASQIPGYAGSLSATPQLVYNGLPVPQFGDVKELDFIGQPMSSVLWGRATSTQQNLNFSGGSDRNAFRVSLGYLNDGSQLQYGNNGNQRYNLRFNNQYKFSDKVELSTNISLERNNIQQPTLYTTGSYSALGNGFQPGIPAFTQSGKPYQWGGVISPPGQLRDGGDNLENNTRAMLNSILTYKFLKHLTFTGTAGYNLWYQDDAVQTKAIQFFSYDDKYLISTTPSVGTAGNTSGNENYYRQNIVDPYYNLIAQVSYANTFKKDHDVMLMLGASYERDEYDMTNSRTYNLGSDDVPSLSNGLSSGTAGFVSNGEVRNHFALASYLGRFTYAFKGKYLLEATGRYDGTSNFIDYKRWHPFGSLQLGWRISEEAAVKKLNIFDNLKLRASYGTTGNQSGIKYYDYIQQLIASSSNTLLGSSIATKVATDGSLVSLDRTWETVKKTNIGLDFSVLRNRLSGTFDLFKNYNNNMLISVTYPGVLGASAPQSNNGNLETWGWEGMLTWKDRVGQLGYSISANITDSQNKLIYYNGSPLLGSGYNGAVEGYPLGSYFGLQYAGRLQTQEQVDNYNKYYSVGGVINNIGIPVATPLTNLPGQNSGLRPGDNSFADVNGDGKLSTGTSAKDMGDLVYLGSDVPRYTFGLNIGLQWKGFDFYSIFQGVGKRTIFRANGSANNWRTPYTALGQAQAEAWVGKTWSPTNTDAYFPNLHTNGINAYNYQASTWSVESGAYVRLKNVVLGYTLPKALLERTKAISALRVYISGSDLWEISGIHDGWDPETTRTTQGNERYPFYRYLTLGANITF
ncbi:TonB-dependent receptor [Mucilaginibacter sp. HMF5004]|uniref:SusC/RagA family TonB-linked outer membrane protein n=1 Tax=Mucilaginibacter rivuli TaxID=2857527 RepID=UPI001C5DF3D6|nr:TonB-dependent receptor [Mucilaginibacter rivuli]MBW4889754.1 TonB-dependent receptor [Mucilaginibacter rivuli]